MTDVGFKELVDSSWIHCPSLETFSLFACPEITDESIACFVEAGGGRSLRTLSIFWQQEVSSVSIERLAANGCGAQLQALTLQGASFVVSGGHARQNTPPQPLLIPFVLRLGVLQELCRHMKEFPEEYPSLLRTQSSLYQALSDRGAISEELKCNVIALCHRIPLPDRESGMRCFLPEEVWGMVFANMDDIEYQDFIWTAWGVSREFYMLMKHGLTHVNMSSSSPWLVDVRVWATSRAEPCSFVKTLTCAALPSLSLSFVADHFSFSQRNIDIVKRSLTPQCRLLHMQALSL